MNQCKLFVWEYNDPETAERATFLAFAATETAAREAIRRHDDFPEKLTEEWERLIAGPPTSTKGVVDGYAFVAIDRSRSEPQ